MGLKENKTPDMGNLVVELIEESEPLMKEMLFMLVSRVYSNGELPSGFVKRIVVTMQRKLATRKCELYLTI